MVDYTRATRLLDAQIGEVADEFRSYRCVQLLPTSRLGISIPSLTHSARNKVEGELRHGAHAGCATHLFPPVAPSQHGVHLNSASCELTAFCGLLMMHRCWNMICGYVLYQSTL